jgi:hypothetical protein
LFFPFISKSPAFSGIYQESDPEVILEGNWALTQDAQASGSGIAISSTPGNSVRFTFWGDKLVLYRKIGAGGGFAEV